MSVRGCSRATGALPTRTKSCGRARLPVSSWMTARLFVNSVICVSVQVASPAMVHSIRTLESASPQLSASARVYSGVDKTSTFASSVRMSGRRSPYCVAGNAAVEADSFALSLQTPAHSAARPDSREKLLSTIAFRRGSTRRTV